MTIDTDKLKALALAAGDWTPPAPWEEDRGYTDREIKGLEFAAAACPATVLELIAERDELRAEVERLRADVETRDGLLRALNAVAIERGDKYGACDCIDNDGSPYQSQHLAEVLAAGAPAAIEKEKA